MSDVYQAFARLEFWFRFFQEREMALAVIHQFLLKYFYNAMVDSEMDTRKREREIILQIIGE